MLSEQKLEEVLQGVRCLKQLIFIKRTAPPVNTLIELLEIYGSCGVVLAYSEEAKRILPILEKGIFLVLYPFRYITVCNNICVVNASDVFGYVKGYNTEEEVLESFSSHVLCHVEPYQIKEKSLIHFVVPEMTYIFVPINKEEKELVGYIANPSDGHVLWFRGKRYIVFEKGVLDAAVYNGDDTE